MKTHYISMEPALGVNRRRFVGLLGACSAAACGVVLGVADLAKIEHLRVTA